MAGTGHTSSISFGTSGFTAAYTEIGGASHSRGSLGDSDLTTEDDKTFQPEDLADPGDSQVTFWYDPDEQPPINAAKESIVITFPTPPAGAAGATRTCDGFLTDSSTPTLTSDQLMQATATIKWSGTPVFADAT